jgi:hypothetical protein
MVRIKERQTCRGAVRFQVYENGERVRDYENHNLIVNGANAAMAHLVAGDFGEYFISKIACGTSGGAADVTDTEIADAFSKTVGDVTFPEAGQVQFDWHLANDENNGTEINEFGLLTEDDTLFARIVLEAPINKTAQIAVDVQWVVIFTQDEEEGDGESD